MITDFKLFEKSMLTKIDVPDKLMKVLQKSFQFKYEIPKKVEKPTKAKIKKLLTGGDPIFVFMVNKESDTYIVVYRNGRYNYGNHFNYTKYEYTGDGRLISNRGETITHTMKDIVTVGFDVYTMDRIGFKGYRSHTTLNSVRSLDLRNQKIIDFVDYFNENTVKIMNKLNAKRWKELVDAIKDYYSNVTKDIDTFVNRQGDAPSYYSNDEKYKRKGADFASMAHTLHKFAEKINDDGAYKLERGTAWQDNDILSKQCYKDILNFLKTRDDFKFDEEEENVEDIIAKAVDQYGVMKMSTLFGRFIMTKLIDWLRDKTGEYTGMDKEMDKYNI